MAFVPPLLFFLFGAAFIGLWALERKLRFALTFAAGFFVLAFALFLHVSGLPPDIGLNAVICGFFYAAGVLLVGEGILQRSGRHFPRWKAALYLAGIVGGLWYFFYVDRDLIARIYILNFGMGLILLQTCWEGRFLLAGSRIDKALFWLLALFGLHFLPRTLLTIDTVQRITTPREFAQTEFWKTVVLTTSLVSAVGGLCLLGLLVADMVLKLRQERDLDPLTGVFNRRGLERYAGRRGGNGFRQLRIIAACDLDRFKTINDTHGHDAGDGVLAEFAEIIRRNVRKSDTVARVGGEEFVLVLEDITEEEAFAFAERVRKVVEKTSFRGISPLDKVTCSFGLARVREGEPFRESLKRADKALYAAKRSGRNRSCAEWLPEPASLSVI